MIADGTFSSAVSGDLIGWWEYEPEDEGDDTEISILPSSMHATNGQVETELDCDLDHTEAAEQGFAVVQDGWRDIEITSHFFVKTISKASGYIFFEARSAL